MNDELIESIKEFYIKQQKLLDEMTNYSKTQLISIIEREMNENHYLRNEIGQLRTELNTKDNIINYIWQVFKNGSFEDGCDCIEIYEYLKQLKENNNA